MVKQGPAKKLTIYVDETDRFHGRPVYPVVSFIATRKVARHLVFWKSS